MDAVDCGDGKPMGLAGTGIYPTSFLQRVVEFSQICCRHLGKHFLPQIGHYMVLHVFSVVFRGAGPEGGRHLPQPLLQPFGEGHSALLCQVDTLVDVDVLAELRSQFLLGISVDVAEDGITILLVSHYNAAFPTAIVPFAHHAVPGWSALCHLLCTSISNVTVIFIHAFSHYPDAQPEAQNEVLQRCDAVDLVL